MYGALIHVNRLVSSKLNSCVALLSTWLIHISLIHVWRTHSCESFSFNQTKLVCGMTTHSHLTHSCMSLDVALIHVNHTSHSYVWHVSFICVTCLIHTCRPSHMSHSYESHMSHSYVYVWHDSFICVHVNHTCLIHTCRMTHLYSWCDCMPQLYLWCVLVVWLYGLSVPVMSLHASWVVRMWLHASVVLVMSPHASVVLVMWPHASVVLVMWPHASFAPVMTPISPWIYAHITMKHEYIYHLHPRTEDTEWRRVRGRRAFRCLFPYKSPIIRDSFTENDVQLKAS